MADDSIRTTKPEPRAKSGSVISIADRNQELRHDAARRLAERHNAALRPTNARPRSDSITAVAIAREFSRTVAVPIPQGRTALPHV